MEVLLAASSARIGALEEAVAEVVKFYARHADGLNLGYLQACFDISERLREMIADTEGETNGSQDS